MPQAWLQGSRKVPDARLREITVKVQPSSTTDLDLCGVGVPFRHPRSARIARNSQASEPVNPDLKGLAMNSLPASSQSNIALAALLAGAIASASHATVLIQNTAAGYKTGGSTVGGAEEKAYLFTTGSTAFGFGSIEILLTNRNYALSPSDPSFGAPAAFAFQFLIRAVSGGQPGGVLASSAVLSSTATQQHTWQSFTLTSAFTLAANTSYALVLTGPSLNSTVRWGNTDPDTTPTGFFGYSVGGAAISSDSGASWSSTVAYNAFALSAVPGGGGAALLGGLLAPSRRRRR